MTLLVTGGSGQVGGAVAVLAKARGIAADAPDRSALDLGDVASINAYPLEGITAIINCAAYTAVDKAESEPERAFAINATAAGILAACAAAHGIPLIHVSTDYVFDGRKSGAYTEAYTEDDTPNPLSVYGASKLAGEAAIIASGARYAIFRTSWVLSAGGANFLNTMLRLGAERDALGVVSDQIGCPTAADDLAAALLAVADSFRDAQRPSALYHFTNSGQTTWHGLAAHIFLRASAAGWKTPALNAITTADYPTPAPRPTNSVLSAAKFTRDFGYAPRPWQAAVDDILERRAFNLQHSRIL